MWEGGEYVYCTRIMLLFLDETKKIEYAYTLYYIVLHVHIDTEYMYTNIMHARHEMTNTCSIMLE